jgi:hypothetical protein
MGNFIRKTQQSLLIQNLQQRHSLQIVAQVVAPFDFDVPREVARYDDAKRWCTAEFGNRFVWSAQVPEKQATFGFGTEVDAILFALRAPSARVS